MGWTEERWNKEIPAVQEIYREDPLKIYDKHYYCKRIKMRDWEMTSGRILSDALNLKSIIDFGCGLGSYIEGALDAKTEKVFGIDIGADVARECIPERVRGVIEKEHIGKKLDYGKWDCALSIEAGEHLLPEEEDMFVENLINASSRLIVVTVAYSFSYMHLNAGKTRNYWVKKFTDLGCKELVEEEKKLRGLLIGSCKKHIIKKLTVLSVGDI